MKISIEDVEGLDEVLTTLANYDVYDSTGAQVTIGGELGKDLERIRTRLAAIERKVGLREEQDTCLVCNRVIRRKHKSQPLLCEKHCIKWPKCPDCGNSGYNALVWTPKHAKAKCGQCKKVFSGKEMQFRIAAYWAAEYEE